MSAGEAWWPRGTTGEWHRVGRPKMAGMESGVTLRLLRDLFQRVIAVRCHSVLLENWSRLRVTAHF